MEITLEQNIVWIPLECVFKYVEQLWTIWRILCFSYIKKMAFKLVLNVLHLQILMNVDSLLAEAVSVLVIVSTCLDPIGVPALMAGGFWVMEGLVKVINSPVFMCI